MSIQPTQSLLGGGAYNWTVASGSNATLDNSTVAVSPLRWFLVDVVGTVDTEENLRSWSSFIGICIAIAGNVLISLALNIQKYSHTRLQREALRRRTGRPATSRCWDDTAAAAGAARAAGAAGAAVRMNGNATAAAAADVDADEEATFVNEAVDIDIDSDSDNNNDANDDDEPADEDQPLLSRTSSRLVRRNPRNGLPRGTSPPHEMSTLLPLPPHKEIARLGHQADVSYMTSPYWWLGLTLMFVGEAGNFLAYGFAPASIVSPLGVVALISNCVVAPLMLKEPFRRRDVLGVVVSVAGAVVVVWSAEKEETKLGPDEILGAISQTAFEVYFGVTCLLIVGLMQLSSRYGHKTVAIDLGLVALFGGYTVLSTKGISSLLSSSLYHIFQYPIAYLFTLVLVATAVLQVKYINRALQRFDSTQVIPTQFVLFTISVIVGSAILYRDFETVTRERMLKFVTGCALTFTGVYLISSQRQSAPPFGDDDGSDDDHRDFRGVDGGLTNHGACAAAVAAAVPSSSRTSSTTRRSGGGVAIPAPPPPLPLFGRSRSAASSAAASYSTTPEAIFHGLQTAAADPLIGAAAAAGTPLRKRPSESESLHRALEVMPGSNLMMTGYQLQTVIAERVGGSLSLGAGGRARRAEAAAAAAAAAATAVGQPGQPGQPGQVGQPGQDEGGGSSPPQAARRRSSLSLVMDFVKGKRKTGGLRGDDHGAEEGDQEPEGGS